MKKRILSLLKYVDRFGWKNGLEISRKLKKGNVSNLKIPFLKHPIYLRAETSDIPTFEQIFLQNEYHIRFNEKPKVIIDGGANIGLFALKFKNDFPDSKMICIEPDPENFAILEKNMAPYQNVFLEQSGLWYKDAQLRVYDKFKFGYWGMVVEEQEDGPIKALSINTLLKKYNIDKVDILKLDIESSEKQLFSENYKEWIPKVKTLIIELHDWMEKDCSRNFFHAINESLNDYSYSHHGENVIITNNEW